MKVLNEIGFHAKDASYLVPGCRTIIDIGGQDAKIICIQEDKRVADFAINDKCAAGTKRFLSILADTLALSLVDFAFSKGCRTSVSLLHVYCLCRI